MKENLGQVMSNKAYYTLLRKVAKADKIIIGLSGVKGSGKDSFLKGEPTKIESFCGIVGEFSELGYTTERLSIGNGPKEDLMEFYKRQQEDPDRKHPHLYEELTAIEEKLGFTLKDAFAEHGREVNLLDEWLEADGRELKEKVRPVISAYSKKKIDADKLHWTKVALVKLVELQKKGADAVVITDIRFRSDYQLLMQAGGYHFHVDRVDGFTKRKRHPVYKESVGFGEDVQWLRKLSIHKKERSAHIASLRFSECQQHGFNPQYLLRKALNRLHLPSRKAVIIQPGWKKEYHPVIKDACASRPLKGKPAQGGKRALNTRHHKLSKA